MSVTPVATAPPCPSDAPAAGTWRWRTAEGRLSAGAVALICLVALTLALALSATQGAYAMTWADLWQAGSSPPTAQVFWHIRAPRLVMAVLAGGALGLSGALVQGLFRNPLADPGLIGVSSGAALGAGMAIVLGGAWALSWGAWPLMGLSFIGGLVVTVLAWQLARSHGQVQVPLLLLVGVAVNALAAAGLGLLSHMADDMQLRTLTFWLLGSLGGSQWSSTLACGLVVGIVAVLAPTQARALNALALGEAQAMLMGVPVQAVQRRCVVGVALAVGAVTALTGMVGFVGLLAPHATRLLAGPDHRLVLPISGVLGAVLVLLADTAARTLLAPVELPLGVLTGLLGAPLFLWMLRRRFTATARDL